MSEWESKGLSNEKFWPSYTSLSPKLQWNKYRLRLGFQGSCLKQEDTSPITPNNVVNLFIVFELDKSPQDLDTDVILGGCLFLCIKLTKNADPDKHSYIGYGMGFDTP